MIAPGIIPAPGRARRTRKAAPEAAGAGEAARVSIADNQGLDREQPRQAVQEAAGAARRQPHRAARRGGRPARPERRRQDDLLLHHHRPDLAPTTARSASTAHDITAPADVPARAPRHRLSAAGGLDLPRPVGRAEHPRRARGGRAATATRARRGSTSCWPSSRSRHLRRAPALALSGGERRRVEIARALASQPQLHPARRAARRHRPDRRRRHPRPGHAPEGSRHRRADHRSQRARDAGHRRSRLHSARGRGTDGGTRRRRSSPHEDVRRVYLGERFSL